MEFSGEKTNIIICFLTPSHVLPEPNSFKPLRHLWMSIKSSTVTMVTVVNIIKVVLQ